MYRGREDADSPPEAWRSSSSSDLLWAAVIMLLLLEKQQGRWMYTGRYLIQFCGVAVYF